MSLWQDWKSYRRFNRLTPDERNIVFYSESRQDWHHFEAIIEFLTDRLSRTVCHVTSDDADPGRNLGNTRLRSFRIAPGFFRTLLFQMLKADVLVLTMMDLGNFELKRSIHPVHYIYIFHGMGSTHMVDFENSYDHYDSIFCVGPHHIAEIRKREAMKNLLEKHLFEHGYHRLEQLMEAARDRAAARSPGEPATVLVAPTWGESSILNVCGEKLIAELLEAGFRVILRPHYQTRKLSPELVEHLIARFESNPRFRQVATMGESDSLFESDLLICDWSGMAIEYALGLERPVLFIDVPRRIRNPAYRELGIEPFEVFIREEVGAVLAPDRLAELPERIGQLLREPEGFRTRIRALREKWVFNIGRSARVAAEEIARIADGKAKERRDGSAAGGGRPKR